MLFHGQRTYPLDLHKSTVADLSSTASLSVPSISGSFRAQSLLQKPPRPQPSTLNPHDRKASGDSPWNTHSTTTNEIDD